ncbi:hypothetical protein [Peribacillus simplex]|uniref:hypothetical protein n=1 Tax=Peribacillus simplex TaxID=1478 RepID=UPI0033373335
MRQNEMESDKGGKEVKKAGVSLTEFIQEDRFELNSYLTSLFNKIKGRSITNKQ